MLKELADGSIAESATFPNVKGKSVSTDKILKVVHPDGTESFRCGEPGCDYEGPRFASVLGHQNKHSAKSAAYYDRMRDRGNNAPSRSLEAIIQELVHAASSGDAALQQKIVRLERKLADERARRKAAERDLNAIRRVMRS